MHLAAANRNPFQLVTIPNRAPMIHILPQNGDPNAYAIESATGIVPVALTEWGADMQVAKIIKTYQDAAAKIETISNLGIFFNGIFISPALW